MAKVTLRQRKDFDVLKGRRAIGSVTRYYKTWSCCAYDSVGNVYGLSPSDGYRTRAEAVREVVRWTNASERAVREYRAREGNR